MRSKSVTSSPNDSRRSKSSSSLDLVDQASRFEQQLFEGLIAIGRCLLLVLHELHEIERGELARDVAAEQEAAEDFAGGLDVIGLVFLA
jgi:hypothetical protein